MAGSIYWERVPLWLVTAVLVISSFASRVAAVELRNRLGSQDAPQSSSKTFRVGIGFSQPKFYEIPEFETLYGKEKVMPSLSGDWYFFDTWATLGLRFSGSFYTDRGHACSCLERSGVSPDAVDNLAPIEQTMVPVSISLTGSVSPFPAKWISLSLWGGLERIYYQEVRLMDKDEDGDNALTNKFTKSAVVFGGSLHFLMNSLDESTVNSLLGALGIGYVYLSPFIELTRQIDSGLPLSRRVAGIAFTFESIN